MLVPLIVRENWQDKYLKKNTENIINVGVGKRISGEELP